METGARGRRSLLVIAIALPSALLFARLATGISASPDSLQYLYAASRLFSEGALLGLSDPGAPLTIFLMLETLGRDHRPFESQKYIFHQHL